MSEPSAVTEVYFHACEQARTKYFEDHDFGEDTSVIRMKKGHLIAKKNRLVINLKTMGQIISPTGVANFWAGRPKAVHVDAAAFYSSFMHQRLHNFITTHIPITLHLVEGDDNDHILRHFAELKGEIDATEPVHTLQVQLINKLHHPQAKHAVQETLRGPGDPVLPCALSVLVTVRDDQISWEPGISAWTSAGGPPHPEMLGIYNEDLTRHCAAAGLSIFNTGPTYREIVKAVMEMRAKDEVETFKAVSTRHGLIVVSEEARSKAYSTDINHAVRVILLRDLSRHEMLNAIGETEIIANAVLRNNLPHLIDFECCPREIALSVAV